MRQEPGYRPISLYFDSSLPVAMVKQSFCHSDAIRHLQNEFDQSVLQLSVETVDLAWGEIEMPSEVAGLELGH